jgi:hypothetical protein
MEKVGETAPISDEWEMRHRACHRALISACGSPTLIRFLAPASRPVRPHFPPD